MMRCTSAVASSVSSVLIATYGEVTAAEHGGLRKGQLEASKQIEQLVREPTPPVRRTFEQEVQRVVREHTFSADIIGDDEDRGRQTFPHQQRKRLLVHIPVAIVEGDGGNRAITAGAPFEPRLKLVEAHYLEPPRDPVQVAFEHRPADEHRRRGGRHLPREIGHHTVVAEYHGLATLAGERRIEAIGVAEVSGRCEP